MTILVTFLRSIFCSFIAYRSRFFKCYADQILELSILGWPPQQSMEMSLTKYKKEYWRWQTQRHSDHSLSALLSLTVSCCFFIVVIQPLISLITYNKNLDRNLLSVPICHVTETQTRGCRITGSQSTTFCNWKLEIGYLRHLHVNHVHFLMFPTGA